MSKQWDEYWKKAGKEWTDEGWGEPVNIGIARVAFLDQQEVIDEQAATILARDAEIEQLRSKIKSGHVVPKSQIDQMRKG